MSADDPARASADANATPNGQRSRGRARPPRPGVLRRLVARARTLGRLILHFLHPARFVLAPLLVVLLFAGVLLWITGGLAYVAPFVYTLF